jgi:hypothetical protein
VPKDVFCSSEAFHEWEFGKKFGSSKYALNSYRSTWRKLYNYTVELEEIKISQ